MSTHAAIHITEKNKELEKLTPKEIIAWAVETYSPHIGMTSSFGAESIALIHMVIQVKPDIPVYFLETGFHFAETLKFRDELKEKYKLNIVNLTCLQGHEAFLKQYGQLHQTNPDLCCEINKVEPLKRAISGLRAWITGIRRDQANTRRNVHILENYQEGLVKVNPLTNWTKEMVWDYIKHHGIPAHPLTLKGYTSIGCEPCTRPTKPGEDPRAGRWAGKEKTECGIHTMHMRDKDIDAVKAKELEHKEGK